MTTIQELKAAIMEMANETKEGANTAKRIGALFDGVVAEIEKRQTALGFTPENAVNKVTNITSDSTYTQYPSAKVVYEMSMALQGLMKVSSLREIFPAETSSNNYITIHNFPFNSWIEMRLIGSDQFRQLALAPAFADSETILKLTNAMGGGVIYMEPVPVGNFPLCINEDVITSSDGLIAISPGQSIELSWIFANRVVELMVSSPRMTINNN